MRGEREGAACLKAARHEHEEASVMCRRSCFREIPFVHVAGMLMQDLNAQIAQAQQDRDEKSESKAKALQAKADAEGKSLP